MNRRVVLLALVPLMAVSHAALGQTNGAPRAWWFRAGPVVRIGISQEVRGNSYTQGGGVHAGRTYATGSGAIGAQDAFGNRVYDDGFVNTDPGTGNDASTWYWGYENASQYDSGDQTMTYHASAGSSRSRSVLYDEAVDADDDTEGVGIAVSAGRTIFSRGRFTLGLCGGLNALFGVGLSSSDSSFAERYHEARHTVVDTYELGDVQAPGAPYDGPEGGYDGPGPLLPNEPSSKSRKTTGTSSWDAWNEVQVETDLQIYELWLGVQLGCEVTERLSVYATPRASAGYLDADIDRSERLLADEGGGGVVVGQWRDAVSDDDWVLGAGVSVGGRFDAFGSWSVGAFAAYDLVFDEMSVSIGPNIVDIDSGGVSAGVNVGRRF